MELESCYNTNLNRPSTWNTYYIFFHYTLFLSSKIDYCRYSLHIYFGFLSRDSTSPHIHFNLLISCMKSGLPKNKQTAPETFFKVTSQKTTLWIKVVVRIPNTITFRRRGEAETKGSFQYLTAFPSPEI